MGWSVISCNAIKDQLSRNNSVYVISPRVSGDAGRSLSFPFRGFSSWIVDSYRDFIKVITEHDIDVVFVFHIFQHFPSELRRILLNMGKTIPIVGYTHGSHWDPLDTLRSIHYPKMELVDLANLQSLDGIFVTSEYQKNAIVRNISSLNPQISEEIGSKMRVVGLPLNDRLMNEYRQPKETDRITIVYNHTWAESKHPRMFLTAMKALLNKYPKVDLFSSQRAHADDSSLEAMRKLRREHPKRVVVGKTLPIGEYYGRLWKSSMQVSTASFESFGIATVEAMYATDCCVLPDHCSYPELVGDVQEALYPYGEKALSQKLSYFIEDESARKKVAKKLHRRSERFTPDRVTQKIEGVMREAVS